MTNKRILVQMMMVVALVGTFLLASAPAMAQGPVGTGVGFVDADGDGVCDNCGTGIGFVDADGDGICDNYDGLGTWTRARASQQLNQQLGQQAGQQLGQQTRQGNGRGR